MRTDRRIHRWSLLLALLPVAAQANWMTEYDRGEKAIEAKQWAEAEARFQQAIREAAEPSDRKRFQGTTFKPYVPHYFAGLAAYQQGDCSKALDYWQHSATQAVLGKLPELRAKQQAGLSDCTARLAKASAPVEPPVATAPPAVVQTPPVSTAPTASVPSKPVAPPVSTPAKPPVAAPVAAASAAAAPDALRALVDNYLKGSYQALLSNDPGKLPDARARAQGFLLRAAARHALALQKGDQAALQAASADVRAAKAAQASLNPDAVLFSPRFRSFWQQTR